MDRDAGAEGQGDTGQPVGTDVLAAVASGLARLRDRHPRIQCLTNTVAQPITANLLLAAGARVSMATHPGEVADMTRTADGLLINLGTLDTAREEAIGRLTSGDVRLPGAVVLDPVFAELSPLRLALAKTLIGRGGVIVKGNGREIDHLAAHIPDLASKVSAVAATGPVDVITSGRSRWRCANGHIWMSEVSGVGCAAGALIAAMRTIIDDPGLAALSGIAALAIAGEVAAERANGPGSFAVQLIDALGSLDAATIIGRVRITTEPQ